MKHEQYPAYTMLTNSAISNALALECMIEAYIDDKKMDFLEPAFCIANDQIAIIRNIRDISESDVLPEVIRLSARSLGVLLMLSRLSDDLDDREGLPADDRNTSEKELPESILTMTKHCISSLKTIRCIITEK